jgi:hypothetical protein
VSQKCEFASGDLSDIGYIVHSSRENIFISGRQPNPTYSLKIAMAANNIVQATVGVLCETYHKILGESGRTMNVLALINGQGSFMFSYSNSVEAFYEYLPTVNQIIKSVVILK